MKAQVLTVKVKTDHDLSDPEVQHELERLFLGYSSKIESNTLLEIEIVEYKEV